MDEKSIEIRNKAQIATVLADQMIPYWEQQKKTIITDLMVEYRQGKLDYNSLLAKVASLCTIDDLENKLKQDIKRGSKAIERELT